MARWQANGEELSALASPESKKDLTVSGRILVRPPKELYGRTRTREFSPAALENVRHSMMESRLARTTIKVHLPSLCLVAPVKKVSR